MTKVIIIKKSYSELIKFQSFEERFNYISLNGNVGDETFGNHRYLNQELYKSRRWKNVRREIILRDGGNDLGHEGHPIFGFIHVHHIEPITIDDILNNRSWIFDPEYLISVSSRTHNALHYGCEDLLIYKNVTRKPNDTCPWRR